MKSNHVLPRQIRKPSFNKLKKEKSIGGGSKVKSNPNGSCGYSNRNNYKNILL